MKIEVICALNLRQGDLLAGIVDLDAPTRPVQPFANAMKITRIEAVTSANGQKTIQCYCHHQALTPAPATSQVMVIRDS